jgi:hypothetical protein
MAFDESRARDDALRHAANLNAATPTDTARELARLLVHVMGVSWDDHNGSECDQCQRAALYAQMFRDA